MHDAVQLEELGVPSTVMITDPFQTLVASQARNLGIPGYHSVIVPHPISTKNEEYLRGLAKSVADTVRRQLAE